VLLKPDPLLADLRTAFRGYSLDRGVRVQRVRSALPGPGTATVLFWASRHIPAYTVKVRAKFPEQQPVSTIGPDEPGKCEVSAEVIHDAVFVCDDRDLAVSMGVIGGAKLGADAITAELGEVIGGAYPGA
jgi:hypothetical protein